MSFLEYPVAFNFKVPKTGVKLFFDIFKSGVNHAELVDSISGGLFFDRSSSPVFFSHTANLSNGKYFGKLTYKEYPTFVDGPQGPQPNPELLTHIKFTKPVFTGYENLGLTAEIIRSGFTDYPLGITVKAFFPGGQSNPYLGLDYSSFNNSGFFLWTGQIQDNFQINLPIFNNNKWENDVNGKIEFLIDSRGLPSQVINIQNNMADFIIIDDDIPECVRACYTPGIDPPTPENGCLGATCPSGLVLDLESCQCTQPIVICSGLACNPIIPPVEIECVNSLTINGYIFYRDLISTPCSVPGFGNLSPKCAGGHWCDRTDFMPVLKIGNSRFEANQAVTLNNPGGGDREDTFEFVIPGSSIPENEDVTFELECLGNNCHRGVSYVVLTALNSDGNLIKVFDNCVVPNAITSLPFICEDGCDGYTTSILKNNFSKTLVTRITPSPDIAPSQGFVRHPACLRWLCVCITGSQNALPTIVSATQYGGATTNNLNLSGQLWNWVAPPSSDGCYIYGFEFYGWQNRSPNSQWISDDSQFDIYYLSN
jgi:hypothetical protein